MIRSLRPLLLAAMALVPLGGCGGQVVPDALSTDASSDGAVDSPADSPLADLYTCSAQNDCVLAANGCCGGPCGMPTLASYTAVNRRHTAEFAKITCTDPAPMCPGCMMQENPNLLARCTPSGCAGVDLRVDRLSACAADTDCRLRYAGCCESCAGPGGSLTAVRKDSEDELHKTTCDSSTPACPPCVPSYPAGAAALCDPTTRHCVVVLPK